MNTPPLTPALLNALRARSSTAKTRAEAIEALTKAKPSEDDQWLTMAFRVLFQTVRQIDGITPVYGLHRPSGDPSAAWCSARWLQGSITITTTGVTVVRHGEEAPILMTSLSTKLSEVISMF